jgi:hypothetical protein
LRVSTYFNVLFKDPTYNQALMFKGCSFAA